MTTWQLRPAADRFCTRTDGITTWHSFSFGAHYDPDNVSFGALLAQNEELVDVGAGYDAHQHADTEIITWVLAGALAHEDSAGHVGVVQRGTAARLSAGSGVRHSERNAQLSDAPAGDAGPVHFVQLWLRPDRPGRPPSYAVRTFDLHDLGVGWLPVASGRQPDALVDLDADRSTLWGTTMVAGDRRLLPESALGHLYVAAGAVEVEGVGALGPGDALRTSGPAARAVRATTATELLLWESAA